MRKICRAIDARMHRKPMTLKMVTGGGSIKGSTRTSNNKSQDRQPEQLSPIPTPR
ncbi:unnamed protein product, partial [Discosporangium mesarthrocarpum]